MQVDATSHFLEATYGPPGDVGDSYNVSLMFSMMHELGHTAGLHHNSYNGMASNYWKSMESGWLCVCDPHLWTYLGGFNSVHRGYIDAEVS